MMSWIIAVSLALFFVALSEWQHRRHKKSIDDASHRLIEAASDLREAIDSFPGELEA